MSDPRRLAHRAGRLLRTVRGRLTLWYVGLLALILVVFSALLHVSLARGLYDELDRGLTAEARQLASELDPETGRPSALELAELVPPGFVVAVYDRGGRRVVANDARQPLPLLADALARAAQGQQTLISTQLPDGAHWRVLSAPLLRAGRMVGVLQVARSERDVEVALGRLVTLMALAIPLTLILASLGGLFLAARALDPIDRITRTADQISAEDLSKRLDEPATADEVARLAATFNRMLDRLDRAFQRQRQFTADASHELRTPLAVLSGEAELALARPRTPDEYRQTLERIREDAASMSQLVQELLMLTRADAGQEALQLEVLSLEGLAADVVASLAPLAEQRGVRLELLPAGSVMVRADQTRLTQLLVNLVDNGLRYTPPGGTVTVSAVSKPSWAVLRVTDTGIGIAPAHLPHIFERFYRADSARARADGGTGLGLAISRWIVEAHGGQVVVDSRPGAGTTFTVRLPADGER